MIYASIVSNYVVPILVFVSIAIVLGFLLAYFGEKLSTKEDERFLEIRDLLAGANCGGCGYAGCDPFVAALLKGEAKISQCNPTASDKKIRIAEILGVSCDAGEEPRAVVHCGGGGNCVSYGKYVGYAECKSENSLAGGSKACTTSCLGHGDCKNVCVFDAIKINNQLASIIAEKCTACGTCIKECTEHIIGFIPVSAKVYINCSSHERGKKVSEICPVGCIACGICEKTCKFDAIKLEDYLPIIDYKKCTGCGECADKCPKKTIIKL